MKILSLFDWIACWYEALLRAWIHIDKYYASEIDKYAIQVAMKNHPDIIQIWDVNNINFEDYKDIDLLIGWSPCQDLSSANRNWKWLKWLKSGLFYKYLEALNTIKPKYFLLENVCMTKENENIITELVWVKPIEINSSLVSAQNRKRLYRTNIPWITQPEDKWIYVKDILEDKDYICCTQIWNSKNWGNAEWNHKAYTLRASQCNWIKTSKWVRRFTPIECERLQTLPDNYTEWVSDAQRRKQCWNWWTVDVISHIFSFIPKQNG